MLAFRSIDLARVGEVARALDEDTDADDADDADDGDLRPESLRLRASSRSAFFSSMLRRRRCCCCGERESGDALFASPVPVETDSLDSVRGLLVETLARGINLTRSSQWSATKVTRHGSEITLWLLLASCQQQHVCCIHSTSRAWSSTFNHEKTTLSMAYTTTQRKSKNRINAPPQKKAGVFIPTHKASIYSQDREQAHRHTLTTPAQRKIKADRHRQRTQLERAKSDDDLSLFSTLSSLSFQPPARQLPQLEVGSAFTAKVRKIHAFTY